VAFSASHFRVPPPPSQALFTWDDIKKCHSAGTPESSLWHVTLSIPSPHMESLLDSNALGLTQLISKSKLQMDGWWHVHFTIENCVLHLTRQKNNFQLSYTKPQIHLIVDYIPCF
jgi:hypothetical protein